MSTTEQLDLAAWPIFYKMSRRGLAVSLPRLFMLKDEVKAKADEALCLVEFYAGEKLNPSSGDQVAAWLLKNGFKGKWTEGGRMATDERSLSAYDHPAVEQILEYRGLTKLCGTFIDPVIEKAMLTYDPVTEIGTVHPKWRLTKVKSGRVATEDPNLLAFPSRDEMGKKVRSCFISRPGYTFLSLDYSQLEPRIVAGLSGDPALLRIFNENRDLYTEIASEIRVPRQAAKIITLGVLYGMSPQRLLEQLALADMKELDLEECDQLIKRWFATYPCVEQLVHTTVARARQEGGHARTVGGRGRYLPGLFLSGYGWPNAKLREEAERQAFNHLIQGTGMEQLKAAMIRLDEKFPECHPMLAIHDELIYEVPDDWTEAFGMRMGAEMSRKFADKVWLSVSVSQAKDWGQLK